MLKASISAVAALVGVTAMPAYAQSFTPAPTTVSGSGTGYVNGTPCTGATVNGSVDSSGTYVDVTFDNSATACSAYGVTARVWANGSLSNVVVTYLPTSTVICSSGSTIYTNVVEYTNLSGPKVNAFVDPSAPVTVGACAVAADMTVGTLTYVP
ncbi:MULTISPECIES: hypothetical protein [Sphingomonas]|uniref:Uncharacterized protein n=1 Tax=Sphingomonas leidyi TaxID=68569 RepID=A0A7X5V157_9SPHN|nr:MULTISPECIES: hypothetical protein [Sphingomonas]MBN8809848.1 hypothetical protein [Sphingomonas sp.]NIJ65988.1 hypothetical protein [Sphingomonas leidyi]